MQAAPFHNDITKVSGSVEAFWLTAIDGVRLRIGVWPASYEGASKGTVFVFPGRTEYIEKYARTVAHFSKAGFTTLAIDWRGQGLSDRLHHDRMLGHVEKFQDYQKDVAAMLEAATEMDLPKPWGLLTHSMGGCIGLRAVMDGSSFNAVAFSGPMWGIAISPVLRPVAWGLSTFGSKTGLDGIYAPSTSEKCYAVTEPFETNLLTRDRDGHRYLQSQLIERPELQLGGPGLKWLHEALKETLRLHRRVSPDIPCLVLLGREEKIVDVDRIHNRVKRWNGCDLHVFKDARHEIFMEVPEDRDRAINLLVDFYSEMK
ncbi:MAG: alpha/beta hydrolase [Pseudomonadota bacterium]